MYQCVSGECLYIHTYTDIYLMWCCGCMMSSQESLVTESVNLQQVRASRLISKWLDSEEQKNAQTHEGRVQCLPAGGVLHPGNIECFIRIEPTSGSALSCWVYSAAVFTYTIASSMYRISVTLLCNVDTGSSLHNILHNLRWVTNTSQVSLVFSK